MKCISPIEIKNKHDGGSMVVPCGRCVVCKDQRKKQWFIRIMAEVAYCDFTKFFTLTYSNEFLPNPEAPRLKHEDFQRFFKRLRKELKGIRLKYYMCGEYGEELGRPHYHCILMIYGDLGEININKVIRDKWPEGHVDIGSVTPRSVMYCLNYMDKLYLLEAKNPHEVKPYQKMSLGLGDTYFNANKDNLGSKGYITYEGVRYDIPRYAKDKYVEEIKEKIRLIPTDKAYARKKELEMREQLDSTYFKDITDEEKLNVLLKKRAMYARSVQVLKNIERRKELRKKRK